MFVIANHIKYNLNTLTTDNIRYVREFLAETLGTFALVLFGDGAVAQVKRPTVLVIFCFYVHFKHNNSQVVLGKAARNDDFFGGFLNICLGYGFALMIGICIRWGEVQFPNPLVFGSGLPKVS